MNRFDRLDRRSDTHRHGLACPLDRVARGAHTPAEAENSGKLARQEVALGLQLAEAPDVGEILRLRNLVLELPEPGPVLRPGPIVEDGSSVSACRRR